MDPSLVSSLRSCSIPRWTLSDEVAFASLSELGTRLRRREISSEEIARIAIDRTQKLDPKLNSFITFLPDHALQQARAADDAFRRGQDLGPLHGMPISLKDHIATAGVRTTAGAKFTRRASARCGVTTRQNSLVMT